MKLEEVARALPPDKRRSVAIKGFILSLIGIIIFFCPVPDGNSTNIVFGVITNWMKWLFGSWLVPLIMIVVILNAVLFLVSLTQKGRDTALTRFYKGDSTFNVVCYILSGILAVMYWTGIGPEILIGPKTAGEIVGILKTIIWTISLGAGLLILLTAFGALDYVGTLMEPLMRPLYKLPGRSGLDAMASFVGTSSVGVYMTSMIYRQNIYTVREAATIATCFSVVSVPFAAVCLQVAGAMHMFLPVYLATFVITFGMAVIMARIPPLSRKKDVYYNGHVQTEEERAEKRDPSVPMLTLARERAIGRAAEVEDVWKTIGKSMAEGVALSIKAIGTVFLIGTVAMIIAEYTSVFQILGSPAEPLLNLLGVPDAAALAPATVIGFAEMFLPFLYVAELQLSTGALFFISVLGLVQIIYMSEVGAMIIVTKLPVSILDMVVIFIIRTIIAIPIVTVCMHLFLYFGWI